MTDGPVYAIAHDPGGNTYIGGDFSYVGPPSGHGLALTPAGAAPDEAVPDPTWPALDENGFPEVAGGDVLAVAADGHGGWFIGGDFASVGGAEVPRLAHILPDGTLDTSWVPEPDDTVRAIALDSTNYPGSPGQWTLYVGGDFTQVAGSNSRSFAAAWRIDATTGIPASPGLTDDIPDPSSFPLKSWRPGQQASTGGAPVHAIAVSSVEYNVTEGTPPAITLTRTPVVFVGGSFTSIGSTPTARNRLSAIWGDGAKSSTGTAIAGQASGSWNPGPSTTGDIVLTIAIQPTNPASNSMAVYFGGSSTTQGNRLRAAQFIVAATGNPPAVNAYTGWAPGPGPTAGTSGTVRALAVHGNTVYAGGDFTSIGNTTSVLAIGLAALAAVPQSQINTPGCNTSQCPATADGGWLPNPNKPVRSLATSANGATVYAGGDFTSIGTGTPASRNGLAALVGVNQTGPSSEAEGAALPWDAKPAGGSTRALALDSDSLYAGGGFFSVGAEPRKNLAALDSSGVLIDTFDTATACTGVGCKAEVHALELSPQKDRLFVGGAFTEVDPDPGDIAPGDARAHLAALEADDGAVVPDWAPDPDNWVLTLDIAAETLYAGGAFRQIGAGPEPGDPRPQRRALAALDHQSGEVTDWSPDPVRIGPGGTEPFNVYDVEASCNRVYAGGSFNRIGYVEAPDPQPDPQTNPQPVRNSIAELDPDTGEATDWNPDANGAVRALVTRGSIVYAGGGFSVIGDGSVPNGRAVRRGAAALNASNATTTSWNPDADYVVRALAIGGGGTTIYAGGSFTNIGGEQRSRIAALQANGVGGGTGDATNWDPSAFNADPNGTSAVHAIVAVGSENAATGATRDNVYTGGEFTDIGTSAQRGSAQFSNPAFTELPSDELAQCPDEGVPPPDTTPPQINGVTATDGGQTLIATLSEAAAVRVELSGATPGLLTLPRSRARAACVPNSRKARARLRRMLQARLRKVIPSKRGKKMRKLIAKRNCMLSMPPRIIDFDGVAGENRIPLGGPVAAGSYSATITARDSAGNLGGPTTISFDVG